MNYLEAFLREKTRFAERHASTAKTAKTPSVSFGSEPLARSSTSFSPRPFSQKAEITGRDLVDEPRECVLELPEAPEGWRITPAESLIAKCRRHGIALRLDESGRLVVGNADGSGGEPAVWSTLLTAIEAHLPPITALIAAGCELADLAAYEAA